MGLNNQCKTIETIWLRKKKDEFINKKKKRREGGKNVNKRKRK